MSKLHLASQSKFRLAPSQILFPHPSVPLALTFPRPFLRPASSFLSPRPLRPLQCLALSYLPLLQLFLSTESSFLQVFVYIGSQLTYPVPRQPMSERRRERVPKIGILGVTRDRNAFAKGRPTCETSFALLARPSISFLP